MKFDRFARTAVTALGIGSATLALGLTLFPAEASAQKKKKETADGAEQNALSLKVGETKTIRARGVKQYDEGVPGVARIKVTPDGNKFVVTGLKQGTTSLLLINNNGSQVNYSISVFSQNPGIVEAELRQLLEPYMGVQVRTVGTRLFIEGGVSTKDDEKRIKQIAGLYTGQVESLVTVGTGAVDRKLNIRVDLYFVQYNKSSGYNLGVSWPGRFGGVQDPAVMQSTLGYDLITKTATANAAIIDHPLPGLDMAANNGWAKVLKQATLITTNGSEAKFGNGGEEHFLISSGLNPKLEKIKFGTNVTVQPRFDPRTKNLELRVTTDISDLVPPRSAATQLPGRQTSSIETLVFLGLGESLVISGIRARAKRHGVNGLPLLSQIPVLGFFFGTASDAEENIEGAVIVIPSIVESVPQSSYDMIKAAMGQYEDYGSVLTGGADVDEVESYKKDPPDYGKGDSSPKKK
jgi:pilus assembly protein CpaC